jgi:RNA polymerase sigma-70 factor (ECF subfamily)
VAAEQLRKGLDVTDNARCGVVGRSERFRRPATAASQDGQLRVSLDVGLTSGDEADLVRAAQAGDRPSFATLVDRYWDRVYRWLCRVTRDGTVAEDITQETFLKAFAAIKSFRAGSNFRAWLFRIAHNNFVNQRRTIRTNRKPLVPEAVEDHRGPVAETMSREALRLIGEAIAKLPTDFRGALTLRVEEGLSFRDIAEAMGITEETARWRVFKARQKLMAVLEPDLLPAMPNEPKTS